MLALGCADRSIVEVGDGTGLDAVDSAEDSGDGGDDSGDSSGDSGDDSGDSRENAATRAFEGLSSSLPDAYVDVTVATVDVRELKRLVDAVDVSVTTGNGIVTTRFELSLRHNRSTEPYAVSATNILSCTGDGWRDGIVYSGTITHGLRGATPSFSQVALSRGYGDEGTMQGDCGTAIQSAVPPYVADPGLPGAIDDPVDASVRATLDATCLPP